MEGTVLLSVIGGMIGSALSVLLLGVDITFGTSIMAGDRWIGIVLISAVLVPLTAMAIVLWVETRS